MAERSSKESYLEATRSAKLAVYPEKKKAQEEKISKLEWKEGKNYIFKLAKKLRHENYDGISVTV